MRVLLVALNAKYVHTNLALRYLREEVRAVYPNVVLREFSINEHLDQIAEEIYEARADVIGFSCYIWNLKEIVALIRQLHPVCPEVRFVLGGPEVSFEPEEFLLEHPEVDALVIGEGEKTFLELLTSWQDGRALSYVAGAAWNEKGQITVNPPRQVSPDLNDLPLPYNEKEDFTSQIVYLETTRGCPFNCQYCLSSTFKGVRFLDPERFRRMFRHLLKNGAHTIKFVDRTFNANKRHAFKILDIVREESACLPAVRQIRVHCEMAGDLLDEEWLAYFRNYPRGLVQLEIGVQSTHQPTLEAVSRPQSFEHWKKYVPEIKALGIPLHLDLIAGLPEEGFTEFKISFNDVYSVQPDMLQLGFLKVLKGSGLRLQSKRYGLVFAPDPPYTILATPFLTHCEILQLQRIENLVDKYYNSGKFVHVLGEVLKFFLSPLDFYDQFAEFWRKRGWFHRQWPGKALFDRLWEFIEEFKDSQNSTSEVRSLKLVENGELLDALRFDYYLWERPNSFPEWLETGPESKEKAEQWKTEQETIRRAGYWERIIPEFKQMDRRQWNRNTAVAYFTADVLNREMKRPCWYLFYYHQGNVKVYRYDDEWGAGK